MRHGNCDWQACKTLSATKWIDIKSVILLSNYHDLRVVKYIDRQVKGSKNKLKILCPNIIFEYKQYMGRVDLSDQMKMFYQIDREEVSSFI